MAKLSEVFELVPLSADRLSDVLELDTWAFPSGDSTDDLLTAPNPLPWDRTFGITTGGRSELAALHASYPFSNCPVPGGRTKAAGLTWVAVHPQYRRRGLLGAMIDAHFQHCRERGEAISILTASEPAIYGRFGYGLATRGVHVTIPRRAALRTAQGTDDLTVRFETVDPHRHGDMVGRLHAAVERPAWVTRETPELAAVWLSDVPVYRHGREPLRILIAERSEEPVGYALFRRNLDWADAGPQGLVKVAEVVADDPAVAHVLWSRLLDIDLTTAVEVGMLTTDDALLTLLVDVRAAQPKVRDNVWARIVDLPTALAARRYQARLDVVLAVSDELLPGNAGSWRLFAEPFGHAVVERTEAEPDLALDVRELGAAYFAGTSLSELASAGLVEELRPGTLLPCAAAFGWPVAPGSSWIF